MRAVTLIIILSAVVIPSSAFSHGGGLNAEGCHHDRKRGGYHCHRGGGRSSQPIQQSYSPPRPSYKKETIWQVQSLLTELNYKPGPIDGAPGKATKRAIAEFNTQYPGYIDVDDYDDVLTALQKAKRDKEIEKQEEQEAQRKITEAASLNTTPNAFASSPPAEKKGGAGGWLLGIAGVIGAYWLGTKNKRK